MKEEKQENIQPQTNNSVESNENTTSLNNSESLPRNNLRNKRNFDEEETNTMPSNNAQSTPRRKLDGKASPVGKTFKSSGLSSSESSKKNASGGGASKLNSANNFRKKSPYSNPNYGVEEDQQENNANQNTENNLNEEKNGENKNTSSNTSSSNYTENNKIEEPKKKNNILNTAKNGLAKKIKGGANKAKDGAKKELVGLLTKGLKIKLIIISGLIIILLFLIIMVLFIIVGSETAYGSEYCTGKTFDISDITTRDVLTYESGLINWDHSSGQYQFFSTVDTYTDNNGLLRAGDAYVVALGTYFGTDKGAKYVVTMDTGQEFTVVLGDTKSDQHTDPTHRYAGAGDIIEFMTGCSNDGVYDVPKHSGEVPKCKNVQETQKIIYDIFPGSIESIALLSDRSRCDYNGQFVERNSSIYTDSNTLNAIFNTAPGAKANYVMSLRYECVTYAKLRALEILMNNSVLSEEQKSLAIRNVEYAQGNGWQWTAEDNPNLEIFNSDSSCTTFKAGSIIAYSGNGAICGSNSPETGHCGHVAIIESVNEKKGTYVISDSYAGLDGSFRKSTKYIKNKNVDFGGCRGITYLLEVKE